jgi:hypothetical protein
MNIIEKILGIRLLDGILQFTNSNLWKPLVNSVDNRATGFNLAVSDIGKYIRVNSADDVAVTIPSLDFPIGGTVTIEQAGAGTVTVSSSTETVNGSPTTAGQYKCIQFVKVEAKTWTVLGGTV